jgi:exopolyphosphatase/guanosine-5'-triphosphate,3'-diphosphate pyrophosphatase
MQRAATIDIGTNSVLLLIAEERDGATRALLERATITRLGQGVDATGVLAPAAIERTEGCLRDYAAELARHDVSRLAVVATSAMRDARNGEAFLESARAILGVAPEVISGAREAALTFEGALSGIERFADDERLAVFDIGGGSTEIIVGRKSGIEDAVSLDIGAVRLTERHLHADPARSDELAALRAAARQALADAPSIVGLPIVGVAGTVTTLAALVHDVAPYDAARIHGCTVASAAVERRLGELARMTLAERRTLAALDPRRADVIVAGAAIAAEVASAAKATEIVVSDRGVRWGLLTHLVSQGAMYPDVGKRS